MSATVFIYHSMMTGLTGLKPENRWLRLCDYTHIICHALRNYTYKMVDKLLKELSGSRNRSLNR